MPNKLIRLDDDQVPVVVKDRWRILKTDQDSLEDGDAWILPLKTWRVDGGPGVWLNSDELAEELVREAGKDFDSVQLIGVEFPKFSDGRGFSTARQLRSLGFKGELRAIGGFLPDQLHELMRCGFDSFAPCGWPQSLESTLAQFAIFSEPYQGAERPRQPIYARHTRRPMDDRSS